MAPQVLPMGRLIRLAPRQRVRETTHEFSQSDAHVPARMVVHIAPREEQQVYPCRGADPLCEDLSRDAPNATTGDGAACGLPQRYDQSPPAIRRRIPACGPRACAHADAASAQTSDWTVAEPPARHFVGLHCEPVPALGPTSLQNIPAIRRAHPFPEAVAPLTLAPVGLICPFHETSVNRVKSGIIWRVPLVCQVLRAI